MYSKKYDSKPTEDYCDSIGIPFDSEDFSQFSERADEYDLTQEQFDFVMREHAWRVKVLFNPKTYRFFVRILLALSFLNPFAKGIK